MVTSWSSELFRDQAADLLLLRAAPAALRQPDAQSRNDDHGILHRRTVWRFFVWSGGGAAGALLPASSHMTQRWREVDSNLRFPAMVNFVVVPFVRPGCSGWIGAPGREYRGSA